MLSARAASMSMSVWRRWAPVRLLAGTPFGVIFAAAFMAVMVFVMIFAKVLQPYAFDYINLLARLAPPVPLSGSTWAHPAGTDTLGRDLMSRLLVGTQTSMLLALLGTCLGAVLGIALGFLAAHKGRLWDEIIMGLVDFQAAMPWFIIALAVLAFFVLYPNITDQSEYQLAWFKLGFDLFPVRFLYGEF